MKTAAIIVASITGGVALTLFGYAVELLLNKLGGI